MYGLFHENAINALEKFWCMHMVLYWSLGMGAFFFLHDPIDLKFSSLIQRLFLMRFEHSDLINNLYWFSYLILNLVILTKFWCSQR